GGAPPEAEARGGKGGRAPRQPAIQRRTRRRDRPPLQVAVRTVGEAGIATRREDDDPPALVSAAATHGHLHAVPRLGVVGRKARATPLDQLDRELGAR